MRFRTLNLHVRSEHFDLIDARIVSPEHALVIRSNHTVGDDAFQSNVSVIQRIYNYITTTLIHYLSLSGLLKVFILPIIL